MTDIKSNTSVSKEQATKEVTGWLDYKKIIGKKREGFQEQIDVLIEAMCDGFITIDEKFVITHKLKFPIEVEKGSATTELKYQPRTKVEKVQVQLTSVKTGDPMGMVLAYVAALTNEPKALVKSMETADYNLASAIVIFFISE